MYCSQTATAREWFRSVIHHEYIFNTGVVGTARNHLLLKRLRMILPVSGLISHTTSSYSARPAAVSLFHLLATVSLTLGYLMATVPPSNLMLTNIDEHFTKNSKVLSAAWDSTPLEPTVSHTGSMAFTQ